MNEQYKSRHGIDPALFWARVDMSGGPDACWPWTGAKTTGYGSWRPNGKHKRQMLTHRIAFGLSTGQEPEAVCHRCDNRPCCNPAHLFGGTRADNNRDMTAKRRHAAHIGSHWVPKGEEHYRSKLTDDKVRMMREALAEGEARRSVARRFGISQTQARRIADGISWKHV